MPVFRVWVRGSRWWAWNLSAFGAQNGANKKLRTGLLSHRGTERSTSRSKQKKTSPSARPEGLGRGQGAAKQEDLRGEAVGEGDAEGAARDAARTAKDERIRFPVKVYQTYQLPIPLIVSTYCFYVRFLFLVVRLLLLVAMHLFLVAHNIPYRDPVVPNLRSYLDPGRHLHNSVSVLTF